jgi:hypothetical protein
MKMRRSKIRQRALTGICAGGMAFQFGGCEFGEITSTVTIGVEDLLITTIRGFILDPIDQFITDSINEAFDRGEES